MNRRTSSDRASRTRPKVPNGQRTQGATSRPEQQVGEAIRRLREGQRLSVRTLAKKCAVSASFISQVELNQASPSLASLERIANGLGVTLGVLFQAGEPAVPAFIRASERPLLRSEWSRSLIESLGSGVGAKLEVLLITMRPGGSGGGRTHSHETDLLGIVFDGELRLQWGAISRILRRGDPPLGKQGRQKCGISHYLRSLEKAVVVRMFMKGHLSGTAH